MLVVGSVNKSENGLPGANVFASDKEGNKLTPLIGIATNAQGDFTLELPNNVNYLTATYVGYNPQTIAVNSKIDFELTSGYGLDEFVVEAKREVKKPKNWIIIVIIAAIILFIYLKNRK